MKRPERAVPLFYSKNHERNHVHFKEILRKNTLGAFSTRIGYTPRIKTRASINSSMEHSKGAASFFLSRMREPSNRRDLSRVLFFRPDKTLSSDPVVSDKRRARIFIVRFSPSSLFLSERRRSAGLD